MKTGFHYEDIRRVAKGMYDIFNKQRVTRSAAAMSYYLTMTIFPFLIVVYAILNSLNISNENLYKLWEEIIPADVLNVILNYMRYVGGNQSAFMVFIGISVTLSSSSSAFGTLMKIMADIPGRSRFKGFWASSIILSFRSVFSLLFISRPW